MRDIGWVEGRSLTTEWRFADGERDRLPELAAQLVQQRVQVIVAPTNLEAEAARRATDSIPIVTLFAINPVESGFAKSLARPGGNVTGVLFADPEFAARSVQLLKETVPAMRRFGYLYPAGLTGVQQFIEAMEASARALGLGFYRYSIARPEEMATVLDAIKKDGVDALRVNHVGPVQAGTAQLLEFATSNRIATLFTVATQVEKGGLMSYSPKLADSVGRGANFVDRLLKRALPAELPFEYPTRYELVVNLKTAKQLGISVPQSILLRAERLIE
jgi:putative ABC transport system substrate-binding protein